MHFHWNFILKSDIQGVFWKDIECLFMCLKDLKLCTFLGYLSINTICQSAQPLRRSESWYWCVCLRVCWSHPIYFIMMNDGWWKMDDGCWMMDDGWWMMDERWWMMDDGLWMMDDGWWIMDDGWWIMDHGSWIMDDWWLMTECRNVEM